jgi:hypothetical protein
MQLPDPVPGEMLEKRSWEEFRSSGLLWWVNRILHLFGWAIIYDYDADEMANGKEVLVDVSPARIPCRGFEEKIEEEGFKNLTGYLANNIDGLVQEANM